VTNMGLCDQAALLATGTAIHCGFGWIGWMPPFYEEP